MNYCVKLDFDPEQKIDERDLAEDANGDLIMPRYKVFALNDTWMATSGWKMAFETFLNNSVEEDHRKARWNDFRVKHGWTAGGAAEGRPATFRGSDLYARLMNGGEFDISEVRTEIGDVYNFTFGQATTGNFSIFEEYDKHSSPTESPTQMTIETDLPYAELDMDMQQDQFEHLQDAGNQPPYNGTTLDQPDIWRLVADIKLQDGGAHGSLTQSTGYFNAPCGFVVVVGYYEDITDQEPMNNTLMELTAKAGKYKGVHAESMGQAKKIGATKFKVE